MKKLTTAQLLNFCLGFFGLQFAWQMRFILTGPVTESLGASPFIFGLISLAGPVTGIVVQPIIGALSDNTQTRFGRRIPYLLGGAILGALGLILMPHSGQIANMLGENLPLWTGLLIAALMIWLIDGSVNAAQGPYRALVPDNIPQEQHAIANSYLSFSIGLGSVVAAVTAPVLNMFGIQMSTEAQFLMAGIALFLTMLWTCVTFRERKIEVNDDKNNSDEVDETFIQKIKSFFAASPEVYKICVIQFFSWIGIMSLMLFFTQYVVHILYGVPNLTSPNLPLEIKSNFDQAVIDGQLFSGLCFGIFNFVCFVVAIPIGVLASKFGNAKVHFVSMTLMAIAFLIMAFCPNKTAVACAMGLAGIGWASILALPFAMLSKNLKPGTEGSMMGIFNIFISAPQVLVCTVLAWFISVSVFTTGGLENNHWEYAFIVGAVMLIGASIATLSIKEK